MWLASEVEGLALQMRNLGRSRELSHEGLVDMSYLYFFLVLECTQMILYETYRIIINNDGSIINVFCSAVLPTYGVFFLNRPFSGETISLNHHLS